MKRIPRAQAAACVALAAALAATISGQQPPSAVRRIAIRAAHLIDPTAGRRVDDVVVIVEGDRVEKVGPRLAIPPGADTIDLGGSTILPGLIDVHTHLSTQGDDYYSDTF